MVSWCAIWHDGANASAGWTRVDFEPALKLLETFAHSCNANADSAERDASLQRFRWNAATEVLHLEDDLVRLSAQRNFRGRTAGVAMNVGEAFLHHAKESDF